MSRYHVYQKGVVCVVALVALMAGLPTLDLRSGLAPTVSVALPVLGGVTITDGRGTIQQYLANGGFGSRYVAEPVSTEEGRDWMDLSAATASAITALAGPQPVIGFSFRNEIYNINTVNLQQLLRVGLPFAGRQIEPALTGESLQGYLTWLQSDVADACLIVTGNLLTGEFRPPVNEALMHEAVEKAGLLLASTMRAPDGKAVEIWTPKTPPPACRR